MRYCHAGAKIPRPEAGGVVVDRKRGCRHLVDSGLAAGNWLWRREPEIVGKGEYQQLNGVRVKLFREIILL